MCVQNSAIIREPSYSPLCLHYHGWIYHNANSLLSSIDMRGGALHRADSQLLDKLFRWLNSYQWIHVLRLYGIWFRVRTEDLCPSGPPSSRSLLSTSITSACAGFLFDHNSTQNISFHTLYMCGLWRSGINSTSIPKKRAEIVSIHFMYFVV